MVSLQSSLSIEFKQDKVILTHVGKGFSKYSLLQSETIDLSNVRDRSEEDVDEIIQNSISHFLEEHRIKPDVISIGLPRQDVFFKFVDLPKVQGASLKDMLQYEIERHIPFPADSVYYDAQLVGPVDGDQNMLRVAIVAAPKPLVDRWARILDQIGLSASAVSLSALGLADFFVLSGLAAEDATTALVECQDGKAEIVILKGKRLRHCRTIDLGQSSGSAEARSAASSRSQEEELRQKAAAILKELSSYVDGTGESVYIDELYLSGGYSSIVALQGALVEAGFSGRVKTLGPQERVRTLLTLEKAYSLASAVGLGMRHFEEKTDGANLLPDEMRVKPRLWGKRFMTALSAAVCVLLIAVVASAIFHRRMEVDYLQTKLSALDNEVQMILATRRESSRWARLLKELKVIASETLNPLLVLKELDRLLPSDGPGKVWLTNFRLHGKSLSINGFSSKPEELLAKLEESPLFSNARFEGRITSRKGGERFAIVLQIEPGNQAELLKPKPSTTTTGPIGPTPVPSGPPVVGPQAAEPEEEPATGATRLPLGGKWGALQGPMFDRYQPEGGATGPGMGAQRYEGGLGPHPFLPPEEER